MPCSRVYHSGYSSAKWTDCDRRCQLLARSSETENCCATIPVRTSLRTSCPGGTLQHLQSRGILGSFRP
eukprot:9080394-Pyramimonas_sp.AAC.1